MFNFLMFALISVVLFTLYQIYKNHRYDKENELWLRNMINSGFHKNVTEDFVENFNIESEHECSRCQTKHWQRNIDQK